ncbi:hypothetical protein [Paenibacillus herberti]|uniref:LSM domain-containing protein n=1 Tax=Paenibacillus herberti TaxID=1619309 RepID=A0A229P5N9_9BACL|nr:hypothetical protein [Paenibacillus herberti]OXM17377.1 hypothetical protein CGZ75_12475 [Paenibacillus herberti]
MQQIQPLHEDNIKRFCGMPVCMVLRDGSRYTGILTACQDDHIFLNGGEEYHARQSGGASISSTSSSTKGKKSKTIKKAPDKMKEPTAQIKAFTSYPGYPYGSRSIFGGYPGYRPYGYGYRNGFGFGAAFAVGLSALAFLLLLI